MLYVFLGAVNRDPARYPEPDRLDINRDLTHHLAFSFGAYYCIGAALARTETAVGMRTLLDRFPGLRPAGDSFEWRNTLQLRGPQLARGHLVAVDLRAATNRVSSRRTRRGPGGRRFCRLRSPGPRAAPRRCAPPRVGGGVVVACARRRT